MGHKLCPRTLHLRSPARLQRGRQVYAAWDRGAGGGTGRKVRTAASLGQLGGQRGSRLRSGWLDIPEAGPGEPENREPRVRPESQVCVRRAGAPKLVAGGPGKATATATAPFLPSAPPPARLHLTGRGQGKGSRAPRPPTALLRSRPPPRVAQLSRASRSPLHHAPSPTILILKTISSLYTSSLTLNSSDLLQRLFRSRHCGFRDETVLTPKKLGAWHRWRTVNTNSHLQHVLSIYFVPDTVQNSLSNLTTTL